MSTSRRPGRCGRSDPARMRTVLYTLAEVLRHLGDPGAALRAGAAAKLLDQLAVPAEARAFAALDAAPLAPGTACRSRKAIFPRFVEEPAA